MGVTRCTEIDIEGHRAFDISLADGTVAKRKYRVLTNDPALTEPTVFTQSQSASPHNLPAPLAAFPGSTTCFSHHYSISRDVRSTLDWLITVDYKTIFMQVEIDRNTNVDPTARPTLVSGQSRTLMMPSRSCLRFGPYTTWPGGSPTFAMQTAGNSAGDPLDPPIEIASTEWQLHFEKNVSVLPSWWGTYNNGINNADQTIYIRGSAWVIPKGLGKLSNLVFSTPKRENGVDFLTIGWDVTTRLARPLNLTESSVPSPWDVERLDEGMRVRASNGANYAWKNVRDQTGIQSVTTPVPFDGSGQPIATGATAIAEADLKRYCYRPFQMVNYSALPWT